jgi:hypothetical protein
MRYFMKRQLLLIIACACQALAQNSVIPAAMGYTEPPVFQAAPGQVVTLFLFGVPGLDGRLRSAQAPDGDLPTSLAGISMHVFQGDSPRVAAGIFAVRQLELCGLAGTITGDQSCLLTLVKIQFPYEFSGDPVLRDSGSYTYQLPALLSIDVDGRRGRQFPLQPIPDSGHILTTCDASWDTKTYSICDRLVYHADGSVVTPAAPANAGETVYVLYYGLGRTDPAIATGQVSPAGINATELIPDHPRVTLGIEANFLNALSSEPRQLFNPETAKATPVPVTSAVLAPGQIGIYQVSFIIPAPSDALIPCGGEVRSNSLLLASTSQGVESIGFCIQQ